MDGALARQIILNSPTIFSTQNAGRNSSVHIECGDGWFDLVDRLGESLTSLSHQTGFQLYIPLVASRRNSLWVRWEAKHQLLSQEREDVERIVLRYAAISWTICEVCGRYIRPLEPPGFSQHAH